MGDGGLAWVFAKDSQAELHTHSKLVTAVAQGQGLPWRASNDLVPSTEGESFTRCPSGWQTWRKLRTGQLQLVLPIPRGLGTVW